MATQRAHYKYLRDVWTNRHVSLQKQLWEKHKDVLEWLQEKSKQATVGSIGTFMLFSLPVKPDAVIPKILASNTIQDSEKRLDPRVFLIHDLSSVLPEKVEPLTSSQESKISAILKRYYDIEGVAKLDGKRLNRSYGLIGAEQHLVRFPGDTIVSHFAPPAGGAEDLAKYYSSGMAPGRGAWGYFGSDEKATMREKYYIAVQTFLAPGWKENARELYNFFKFRKMIVVNPQNGKAIVVVIGDAGPAEWTGKHLGGSPEVMKYLERVDGETKGPVLYFFLDDPDDKIPLGPLDIIEPV